MDGALLVDDPRREEPLAATFVPPYHLEEYLPGWWDVVDTHGHRITMVAMVADAAQKLCAWRNRRGADDPAASV